jgi:vacuolar-type H+-ATPase subunit E/Vma4
MTNRERIEAYFDDQLSTTEKESLLRDIESDPSLKAEFDFQNEVVEGIQNFRKEELITRLNNVEVASVGTSALTKIIGTIGVAAIVTGGLYWYFGSEPSVDLPEDKVEIIEEGTSEQEIDMVTPKEEEPTEVIVIDKASESTNEESSEPASTRRQQAESSADVNVPVMVEPATDGIAAVEDNHDAPESLNSEPVSVTSSADVEIKLDKQYKFHYQVVDGDLTLFGDFNKSKFELIELKTNLGIKLYLYYNELYYELKSDSSEIRPLVPLDNQEVIDELEKRRK